MGITQTDFQFMVETLTADLIDRLVQQEHYSLKKAADAVYASETYAALLRPETCLYYQSPGYVMHYLKREFQNKGKVTDNSKIR